MRPSLTVQVTAFIAVVLTSLSFAAPAALAEVEDHVTMSGHFAWIPDDETLSRYPEIGPYRDHYIHEIRLDRQADGHFQMQLRLPEDLSAGRSTVLTFQETERTPEGDYVFTGPQGYLICSEGEYSWADSGCKVELYPLNIPAAQLRDYSRTKYRGTRLEQPMSVVSERFGTEPIGKVGLTHPEDVLDGGLQGNGRWRTQRQLPSGRWENSTMTIDFSRGVFDAGSRVGLIGDLYYDGTTVEGGWGFNDDEYGRFRFTFDGDSFTGEWYRHDDPTTYVWNGRR